MSEREVPLPTTRCLFQVDPVPHHGFALPNSPNAHTISMAKARCVTHGVDVVMSSIGAGAVCAMGLLERARDEAIREALTKIEAAFAAALAELEGAP